MHMTPWQSISIHWSIDVMYKTKTLVLWMMVSKQITQENLPGPCRCKKSICRANILFCVRYCGCKIQTVAKMLTAETINFYFWTFWLVNDIQKLFTSRYHIWLHTTITRCFKISINLEYDILVLRKVTLSLNCNYHNIIFTK